MCSNNTIATTTTTTTTNANTCNKNNISFIATTNVCGSNSSRSSSKMSRKDDPVFNVKFVQLVENHPCLWNSTHPGYSKKEEIQKAWQDVANETKDTVRNCRERWRTIRSSFLRSLKLARTTTGRGKRKYYLSKYLQFLIPHTKTRLKNGSNIIALRKADYMPPMTRITNMPLPIVSSDETKDSSNSEVAIADGDVLCAIQDDVAMVQQRLVTIKTERGVTTPTTTTTTTSSATPAHSPSKQLTIAAAGNGGSGGSGSGSGGGGISGPTGNNAFLMDMQQPRSSSAVDLTEFADWIKSKHEPHRHCLLQTSPDADQSFLNSLHPFLKEMSGKQNRRFRQKVVALIDTILDDVD